MGFEFLSLGWLYAAPLLLGSLVLLYFLKLKRREVTVSSTYLWQTALNDLRVNSPFQRLRMNLLLLLQLLVLLGLILALARPVSNLGGLKGTDAILLIDISASMQATDGGGGETRFQRAIAEAKRVVEDLSYGDRAIIIGFADEARGLTNLTDSKSTLLKVLDELEVTDRPTRLASALERVRALLNSAERDPELYVFSDGRVGPLDGVVLEEEIPLHYITVGSAADNVGIIGVDAHVATGLGEDTRVFVSVLNAGGAEVSVGVDLYVDDELQGSRELRLPPGGVASAPFDAYVDDEGSTRRVRVELDHEDAFPGDNVAHALLAPPTPIRTLLVSGGNLFLHSALSEDPLTWKTPRGGVPLLAPEDFDPGDARLLEYDVVVLDRITPEALPPGNYLCFGARPPFEGFEDQGQVEGTQILDWNESHPVARFVNFATLDLPTSRRFKLRDKDDVIVRATYGPILTEAREGDRRAVVLSFNLLELPVEGAWTFDPSFPIFLANAVRYLGGGGEARARKRMVRTGGVAELAFPTGSGRALLETPGGEPLELAILETDELLRVTSLDRAGIYTVAFQERESDADLGGLLFAANLVDTEESRIAPASSLLLEGREVVGTEQAIESNRDVWKLAAAFALLFVFLEWWLYNRRVFI